MCVSRPCARHMCWRPRLSTFNLLLCIPVALIIAAYGAEHHANAGGQTDHLDPHALAGADPELRAQLSKLVESVEHAAGDAKAAHEKRDVVDLGASLRLMEDKFGALRNALLSDMGLAVSKAGSGSNAMKEHAQDLAEKGTSILSRLGSSRSEIHSMLNEIRTLDTTMAELRQGLKRMEEELHDLKTVLTQAHMDNGLLHGAHNDLRNAVAEATERTAILAGSRPDSGVQFPKWYFVLFVEMLLLAGFAAYKQFSLSRNGKFNKMG